MGLRFRKSIKIAPGLKINLSKSGISATAGVKGASVNVGKNGTYLNTGIPGTGIYAREKISGTSSGSSSQASHANTSEQSGVRKPTNPYIIGIVVAGVLWFSQGIGYGVAAVGICLLFSAINHLGKKTKAVYGKEPVYKADRRYKTGRRLEGYKSVKIGTEPLTEEEIKIQRAAGKIRLAYLCIVVFTFCIALMFQ